MIDVKPYLKMTVDDQASDLIIMSGMPISYKLNGYLKSIGDAIVMPSTANEAVTGLYELAGRSMERYEQCGDDDFPLSIPGLSRFRVSTYRQRGSMAAVIRIVKFDIPSPQEMHIPNGVIEIANKRHGLALVTGPTGCGKSTTLACIIDEINKNYPLHIITLEDPIEYLHKNKMSAISQREIGSDTDSYVSAMRACMRQAPDVILLGEMRDYETIMAAMTAAETGHLVLSTLHTVGAVNTIDRIIDVFPSSQQSQIRMQMSLTLQTVVSQQLLPTVDGGQAPVFEIMHFNSAIRNMIRESKTHQIDSVIQSSTSEGMMSMDASILELFKTGRITAETAIKYAMNPEQMERRCK